MLFLIFIEYMKQATTCLIKNKWRAFLYDIFLEHNLYYKNMTTYIYANFSNPC